MTDFNTLVDRYIAVWNETDAETRRALIAQTFTESAHFIDPLQQADGQSGIDTLVQGVQQKFPAYRFRRAGGADGFGTHVRFRWQLVPEGSEPLVEGTDFGEIVEGRLHRVTGFFDKVPAAA